MSTTFMSDKTQVQVWTSPLIKRLRAQRSLQQFAILLGTTANTVWRWEDRRSVPDERHQARLTELAEHEHFFVDWKLVGSMEIVEDFEVSHDRFRKKVKRTLASRVTERMK